MELTALRLAIANRWPFVVLIEFGSSFGENKTRFMASFERMLNDHPEQPFLLTHMGQLKPSEFQRLIQNHKNLYFHTGWTNPTAIRSSQQPWVNLFNWTSFFVKQMEYWKEALAELPVEVAHLVAHGNAGRLWHIAPRN